MRRNQKTIVLYIACSLDGYIAGKDDDISWLFSDQDYGYSQFRNVPTTSRSKTVIYRPV